MKNWDMDERCRKGDSTVFPKAIPTAHCKDAGDSGELTTTGGTPVEERRACGETGRDQPLQRGQKWCDGTRANPEWLREDAAESLDSFFCYNMKTEEVEGRTMTLSVIAMRKGCPWVRRAQKEGTAGSQDCPEQSQGVV